MVRQGPVLAEGGKHPDGNPGGQGTVLGAARTDNWSWVWIAGMDSSLGNVSNRTKHITAAFSHCGLHEDAQQALVWLK